MTNTYRFYIEDDKWYIDLPEWTGSKEALQMVLGADDLLDILTNSDEITLEISDDEIFNTNNWNVLLKTYNNPPGDGATYMTYIPISFESLTLIVWLCPVTLFIFGYYPDKICYRKA